MATQHDVAVLLSAHEMNVLLPVMDRIVYLAGGRAVSGTTDEVVRQEVLSALYGYHVDVLNVHGRVIVVAGPGHEVEAVLPVDPPTERAESAWAGSSNPDSSRVDRCTQHS